VAAPAPVVIEAAINGLTSPTINPHVPVTPEQVAADALACFDAGASIVHHHADVFGVVAAAAAERYLEAWRPVWAQRPDALVYPTVHVEDGQISYEHLGPLAAAGVRIGLADPGSVNLGPVDDDGVPIGSFVYTNPFDTVARALELCEQGGLGPSIAIYEPGFLRAALAWWRAGRLPRGAMVKLYFSTERGYFGAPFGLPPTMTALDAYLELLEGCDLPWAVSVVGGDVVASDVARAALGCGGHLHLGLEFFAGDRRPSNAELVAEAVELCADVGRPVATCAQTAQILDLP
jgi:3-keto-5-aminohexanoate cleavage enzyme